MLTISDIAVVTQIAGRLVKEAIANTTRGDGGLSLPVPRLRPGTVGGIGGTGGASGASVMLRVDGDFGPIAAINAQATRVRAGDRVMVMFLPPHGVYIVGSFTGALGARIVKKRRTGGNVPFSGATWQPVDTALDIVVDAIAGDWIEYGVTGAWSNEVQSGYLDAATLVGGVAVHWFLASGTTTSVPGGWAGEPGMPFIGISGTAVLQLDGNDITNGTVTLRLFGRAASAANKSVQATPLNPLTVFARNLGI